MSYELEFEKLVNFDTNKIGISVNVELRLGLELVTFEAKIDTGASFCIFAREYAEKLGVRVEEGFIFDSQVFFAADENFHTNVLGRHGWLDRVIIAINDYDGKLYLSRFESE